MTNRVSEYNTVTHVPSTSLKRKIVTELCISLHLCFFLFFFYFFFFFFSFFLKKNIEYSSMYGFEIKNLYCTVYSLILQRFADGL